MVLLQPRQRAPNRTFAYVAFGVGGAALLVGAVTGILAIGKHGDLKDACPDATCPSTKQSDVDSYKTMGTISTVGFVVGGVGVAAGAILLLTAPKQESALARYTTVRVAGMTLKPYVAPTAAGLIGSF